MNKTAITRISLDEALKAKGQGKTDWARVAHAEELDGEAEAFGWAAAEIVVPRPRGQTVLSQRRKKSNVVT